MQANGDLLEAAAEHLPTAVELRRAIHRQPELGLDLPATQRTILEAIEGLGLEVELGRRASSITATLVGARPGRSILLRADMDALPLREDTGLDFASQIEGKMHACGHDAHVAMLVGAARLLAARRGELAGRVVFMFQPGEEGHHGARLMLEEGLLEREPAPSAAFAIHIVPTLPAGFVATRPAALLAATDDFVIKIRGRGGHAAMPHNALDPIPVACALVQAIQSYVTRRVDAFDPAVVTVAKIESGTTINVIPETARLWGTIRTVSERTRAQVTADIRRLAEGIASAHDATAEVHVHAGYPVTSNDPGFARFSLAVARELLGEEKAFELPSPFMGGEDFSYVLQRLPGAMVFLGARPTGEGHAAPNHSNRMILDEGSFAAGIALNAAVALRYLSDGSASA